MPKKTKTTFVVTIEVDGEFPEWRDTTHVRARLEESLLARFAVAELKTIEKIEAS